MLATAWVKQSPCGDPRMAPKPATTNAFVHIHSDTGFKKFQAAFVAKEAANKPRLSVLTCTSAPSATSIRPHTRRWSCLTHIEIILAPFVLILSNTRCSPRCTTGSVYLSPLVPLAVPYILPLLCLVRHPCRYPT